MQTIALILFIITYVLMIALSEKRPYVALISAILYVVGQGIIKATLKEIDDKTLLLLGSLFVVITTFSRPKPPAEGAAFETPGRLLCRLQGVSWKRPRATALGVFYYRGKTTCCARGSKKVTPLPRNKAALNVLQRPMTIDVCLITIMLVAG